MLYFFPDYAFMDDLFEVIQIDIVQPCFIVDYIFLEEVNANKVSVIL